MNLEIKQVTPSDFETAVQWAADEGWNPGLDDAAAFFSADAGGFFMGFQDRKPISSISVVRYGPTYGFLGFYIVHPGYRGTGAGLETWNTGMAYLGDRVIGLDGVVAQQHNYKKSGFVLAGRNIRYRGVPVTAPMANAQAGIRPVNAADLTDLIAYDAPFFAAPRGAFIENWVAAENDTTRKSMLAIADGEIAGYGVIRTCRDGYKIGPLFADNTASAHRLFTALCATTAPGSEISLDTPEDNPAAIDLANQYGFEPVFETARMYRGPMPSLPVGRTFGITTFELG